MASIIDYIADQGDGSSDGVLYTLDSVMRSQSDKPFCIIYMVGEQNPLHTSLADDGAHRVLQPKLKLEINQPGSLTFTILPVHPLYSKLEHMKTRVTVEVEGVELFRGRITGWTTDVNRQKNVTCEGDLGYLLDSVQKPGNKFSGDGKKVAEALRSFISGHNKAVGAGDPRQFSVGSIASELASKTFYMDESQDYEQTRSLIDQLIDNFGGYLRTSSYKGITKLDYLYNYTDDRGDNPITFGRNMITFSQDLRADDLFTVLIPEGENPKKNRAAGKEGKEEKLDISGASLSGNTFDLNGTRQTFEISGNELIWVEGRNLYGRILRQQTFQGVKEKNSKNDLVKMAKRFFRDNACTWDGALSVTAIDMRYLGTNVQPIRLGSRVPISIPAVTNPDGTQVGAFNKSLVCLSIEYDLSQPSATNYTFGWPYKPLAGRLAKKVEQAEKKADKAEKAAKKAGGGGRRNSEGLDEHQDKLDDNDEKWKEHIKDYNKLLDRVKELEDKLDGISWVSVSSLVGISVLDDDLKDGDGVTRHYVKDVVYSPLSVSVAVKKSGKDEMKKK